MDSKLYIKIKRLRKKLDKSIEKNGVLSKETRDLSNKMDNMINMYYKDIETRKYSKGSSMYKHYKESYRALKRYTERKKFPLVEEWDKYARENGYLSHLSIEYISLTNWREIEKLIIREINMKIYE